MAIHAPSPYLSPNADAGIRLGNEAQARSTARNQSLAIVQKAGVFGLQLLGLWAISFIGAWVVRTLALPIPGNLAGIIILYTLLSVGVVKVAWLDAVGSLLVKNLAFFFIPIAVGVMNMAGLLASHGAGITLTLIASAAIGIGLSGFVAQRLAARSEPGEGS
jgi:holin-like protein